MGEARQFWAYWDCKHCGSKGFRGDVTECPNCGRVRDKDVVFYKKEGPVEYVENAHELPREENWICSFCDSQNPANVSVCGQCGAPKDKDAIGYFEQRRREQQGNDSGYAREHRAEPVEESHESHEDDLEAELQYSRQHRQYSEPYQAPYRHTTSPASNSIGSAASSILDSIGSFFCNLPYAQIGMLAGIALAVGLVIWGIVWLCTPIREELQVSDMMWQYSINIEESYMSKESGWDLPHGAILLHEEDEIKTYVPVIDHYDTKTKTIPHRDYVGEEVVGYEDIDLGNGRFERREITAPKYEEWDELVEYEEPVYRNEPVWATKYYYEIERWRHARYVKTSGHDKEFYWGTVELEDGEREGASTEKYTIFGYTSDNYEQFTCSQSIYNMVDIDKTIVFEYSRVTKEITSLIAVE